MMVQTSSETEGDESNSGYESPSPYANSKTKLKKFIGPERKYHPVIGIDH
jgi:hypothetical protein